MQNDYAQFIPWKRTSMYKTDEETGKLYVASIKGEGIFCISGIGAFVWNFVNGINTIEVICNEIMSAYEGCTYEQVFNDVKRILDEMQKKDLVIYNWDALA